jgi:hypothetical protein
MLHRAKSWIAVLCLLCLTRMVTAQVAAPELAIPWLSPTIDGDLSDWRRVEARIRLRDDSQVTCRERSFGLDETTHPPTCELACDTNHLYLAVPDVVKDDQIPADQFLASRSKTRTGSRCF